MVFVDVMIDALVLPRLVSELPVVNARAGITPSTFV